MEVRLLHTDVRVAPPFPVELVVAVDDEILRAEIEWSTIEQLIGRDLASEDAVRDFLRHNRMGIELAITAHLFAHGIPLARQFVMSPDDLYGLPAVRAAPGAAASSASRPAR